MSSSGAPAAGPGRPGEVGRIGRVAEREQVLAVLVVWVAEQLAGRGRARRPSPARCRSRAPRPRASSIGGLAEVEHDRERRAVGARGSGVTRAMPTAAPARCPAHGPTLERARRWSRSRHTMNVQRCRFLVLAARRPARRIAVEMAGVERPVGEAADDPLRGDGLPDRIAPGSVTVGRAAVGPGGRPRLGAPRVAPGQRDLGEGAEAAGRVVDRVEALPRRRGSARPGSRRPVARRLVGSSGPPRARSRGSRRRARGSRRPRTATSAGRPRR